MATNQPDTAECIIHNDIKDWFNQILIEACGPDIPIRYTSNEAHCNTRTYVEISGSGNQVDTALELIKNTSRTLQYKMPWLTGSPYYVRNEEDQQIVEQKLEQKDKQSLYTLSRLEYYMTGYTFLLFSVCLDLDGDAKMKMDKIFESLPKYSSPFITYSTSRLWLDRSNKNRLQTIPNELYGNFLSYLGLEDILSLEMATKTDEFRNDIDLHQAIEKYLREQYIEFYEGDQIDDADLFDFKIKDVLLYCIHKYHNRFKKITISNILTADEATSLSCLYSIEIERLNVTHIDFKTRSQSVVDFCAMYHFDPTGSFFPNYDPNCVTATNIIHFEENDSLDALTCKNQFSFFLLKSQNDISSRKTNSVLNYVTEHFKACQGEPRLTLSKFNLNLASYKNLYSLLKMMREGTLEFEGIHFKLKTFIGVLDQSNKQNRIEFTKCTIDVRDGNIISNDSEIENLRFCDMDVELNILVGLRNINYLELINCQVLSRSLWVGPVTIQISKGMKIAFSCMNVSILMQLLNGLQCIPIMLFVSCDVTAHKFEKMYFAIRNIITFSKMKFSLQTLFQIFENCEFEKQIMFDDCELYFENDALQHFSPRAANIQFFNMRFDSLVLIMFLEALNNMSGVQISDSDILSTELNRISSHKVIKIQMIQFFKCKLQTHTLTTMVSKMSNVTKACFDECNLVDSGTVCPNILTNMSELFFKNMKITIHDLFTILAVITENSSVGFIRCEITQQSEVLPTALKLEHKIKIKFENVIIDPNILQHLLQHDVSITIDSCCSNFMSDPCSDIPYRSQVTFSNMLFDLSTHLKSLANFMATSKLNFHQCRFELTKHCVTPDIVIKPTDIDFIRSTFDVKLLIMIMEKLSAQTIVAFDECNIRSVTDVCTVFPIQVPHVVFTNMSLEIKTILCVLKNSVKLTNLVFNNCRILCSNPSELRNIKLNIVLLLYEDMDIDVEMFQLFVQKCADGMSVFFKNCNFIPMAASNTISIVPVNIEYIVCRDVKYTQGLLQMFQYLDGQYIVQYQGELSNQQIIEICTKSPVRGNRLSLEMEVKSSTIAFELYDEYFRSIVFNAGLDLEQEYDLPTNLLPEINTIKCNIEYWSAFKVKFSHSDGTLVKLIFLKNGEPIDLVYGANNALVDSNKFAMDF